MMAYLVMMTPRLVRDCTGRWGRPTRQAVYLQVRPHRQLMYPEDSLAGYSFWEADRCSSDQKIIVILGVGLWIP